MKRVEIREGRNENVDYDVVMFKWIGSHHFVDDTKPLIDGVRIVSRMLADSFTVDQRGFALDAEVKKRWKEVLFYGDAFVVFKCRDADDLRFRWEKKHGSWVRNLKLRDKTVIVAGDYALVFDGFSRFHYAFRAFPPEPIEATLMHVKSGEEKRVRISVKEVMDADPEEAEAKMCSLMEEGK